jgi:hypothetical protein
MDKLTIPNGGMPLHGGDFEWMQSASRDAIKGALHLLAEPHGGNMVLSGCDVTGGVVAPGFVMIDYEVCRFNGGTLPLNTNDGPKFVLQVTYDLAGSDVFADGQVRDTYEQRRAIVIDSFTGLDVTNPPRLSVSFRNLIESFNHQTQVTAFANGWSATGMVFVKLIGGGAKVLYGALSSGSVSNSSTTKIASLPGAEYRPNAERHLPFVYTDPTAGIRHGLVIIKANGDVHFINGDADPITTVLRICLTYY